MAERTTRVSLVANVSNYVAGMEQAARKTRDMGTAAEKLAAQRQGFDVLGRSIMAVGVVAAAGVALAVARFADFDAAMSSVKASTQESAANMGLLREAALQAGGDTVFTATEAAGAIENLAKAGISTADILGGGLVGALDLAAAGEIEVGAAAEIAATAMTQFKLEGSEIPRVADLMAAGAGKAQGSVQDMAAALNQSGLVASQMGLSIEETTGTLTAFASAGLLGSDAGTSFRTMLLRLANPTEEAKDLMAELGINAYDASGNFVGMESIAGQLQGTMGGLDQATRDAAMATLFGSDAIRAANVLYSQGAEGIAGWTASVDDSGYAAKVAADRLDNLQGDLEKLGGAFDTALIQSGSAANDVLRGLVQSATFLVDSIADLPQPVLGAGMALGSVASAVGLVGGGALLAIPKIADFKNALKDLDISGRRAAIGIGAASAAVAGVTLFIGAVVSQLAESSARVDSFADSLDQATGSVTDYTRELAVTRLEQAGAYEAAERMGIGFDLVTDAAMGNKSAMEELRTVSNAWQQEHALGVGGLLNGNAFAYDTLRQSIGATSRELEAGQEQWATTQAALGAVADEQEVADAAAQNHASALADLTGAAADAGGEVAELGDIIRDFGSATLDARAAERNLEAAVDDATAAFKENGDTLNTTTAKGRANSAALDDIASAANDAAASVWDTTKSENALNGSLATSRTRLIEAARQFGMTKAEARAYANQVLATPKAVKTAVGLTGVQTAENQLNYLARGRQATINVVTTGSAGIGGGGAMRVSEDGNLFEKHRAIPMANGGSLNYGSGMYAGTGPLYQFAEPGTKWEAYISGKPGQEERNLRIWAEAGRRLGAGMAAGGGQRSAPVYNITNNYPVAERTSDSIRRASQYGTAEAEF